MATPGQLNDLIHAHWPGTIRIHLRSPIIGSGLIGHGRAAAAETDGIHLFRRWQDPAELYVVSLNRRDDLLVAKKKLPGGTDNGGTYSTLGQVRYLVRYGIWQSFTVRITSTSSAVVTITVSQNGHRLMRAVDDGEHGPLILKAGAVGLRADNCQFEFTGFQAHPD